LLLSIQVFRILAEIFLFVLTQLLAGQDKDTEIRGAWVRTPFLEKFKPTHLR
jgi:hypothetical protein